MSPAENAVAVGLDIGGTKTLAVAIDADGRVVAQTRLASGHGAGVVDAAVAAVEGLRAALPGSEIAEVGVGIPGTVDHVHGEVQQALNLGLAHLPLAAELRARLGIPVHVENDVNAAALGAARAPSTGGETSLAFLNLGTGLAAGIVLDGRLWRGATGAAGEIGHIPIDPAGPECVCGHRGCLELYASGSGIARQWGQDPPSAAGLLALEADGDPRAVLVLDRLVLAVASAVRLLVLAYDVDRIVVGGGLAEGLGDALVDRVLALLADWEASSSFLAAVGPSARVVLAPAEQPLAAIGAAIGAAERSGALT